MKKIYRALTIVLLVFFIAFTSYFSYVKFGTDRSKNALEKVTKTIDTSKHNMNKNNIKDAKNSLDDIEFEKLKKLKEINKDVTGIINVKNTNIYYPIMKSKDNLDYLRKNINGNYDLNGSIFLDYECNIANSDNTIIYGHNMESDNMFSDLIKYNDRKFFDTHKDINIYSDNNVYKYRVLGVYKLDVTKNNSYDFNEYVNRDGNINAENYLKNLHPYQVFYDENVKVNSDSRLLTLATCADSKGDLRTLVVAVKE